MPELNEPATRKAPEAELAESVAECVRLTEQTALDVRAIRQMFNAIDLSRANTLERTLIREMTAAEEREADAAEMERRHREDECS